MSCSHLDPTTWIQRDGKAFCPGCKRFMGYLIAESERKARSKRSRTAADVDADDDRGMLSFEGERDHGETESEEA